MPKPDIQKQLADHLKATGEAIRLLKEALAYSEAGKKELAMARKKQAQKWIDKVDEIEGKK